MKLSSFKPGMVVYEVTRYRMGNTTFKSISVNTITIVSVDPKTQTLEIQSGRCGWARWSKFRAKRPVLIRDITGRSRLATREEIKAMAEIKATAERKPKA